MSSAAQGLHDHHLVGRAQRMRQVAYLFAVDEDSDVPPDAILLIDHAKTNPSVALVQVGENRGDGGAARLGHALLGVRAQRAWYEHSHRLRFIPARRLRRRRSPADAV